MELRLPDGKSIPIDSEALKAGTLTKEANENSGLELQPVTASNNLPLAEMEALLKQLTAQYGVGLDNLVFLPNNHIEIRLADGTSVPVNMEELKKATP